MDPSGSRPEPTPAARPLGRNLPVAIASGVALAAAFLGTLFVSVWLFLSFIVVLAAAALVELDAAFRSRGLRPVTAVAVASCPLLVYGAYAWGASAQSATVVLLVVGSAAGMLLRRGRERTAASLGVTVLMALWVPGLASFTGLMLRRPEGEWLVMAAVALAVTSDIGAYAFGSRFGRHLLAPSVSPGKTWEGLAGGLATVLAVAAAVTARLPGFTLNSALALAAAVTVAATLGDLTESMVKRDLGVKDLGRVLPGHGGIMDRVDGTIFALPVAYLLLSALAR